MAGSNNPLGKKGYFPQFTGYQNNRQTIEMYDRLITQDFEIRGIPCDYVSSIVDENKDRIFGEDTTKKYIVKHKLTSILKEGQVEETLLFNGFGQLNTVEFSMYLHIGTFKNVLGVNQDPKPGDHFFFPHGNSNLGFEVMHVGFSTLGLEGNILGHRTLYEIVARERYVSEADEGVGEQYGVIQHVIIPESWIGDTISLINDNNAIETYVVNESMVGLDIRILVNNAPDDAILRDGRIADKYLVKGKNSRANKGDNTFVREATEGIPGSEEEGAFNEDGTLNDVRQSGNVVSRDRSYWGDW